MRVVSVEEGTLLKDCENFDLAQTLDCGQAFRWNLREDGSWHGVAGGRALTLRQTANGILLEGVDVEAYENFWGNYFDVNRDYAMLIERFSSDPHLKKATEFCPGIRILRQDTWEALCSFIISQNNNIPRIKGIIDRLCENFGEPLGNGDFSFPAAQRLAELTVDDLAVIRSGFRAKYLLDAAKKVSSGEVDLKALHELPLNEAERYLVKNIYGVGPKVARCVLLYGCGKSNAFPVDVWVNRIMQRLYPSGMPECTRGAKGIAQQYLFHYVRSVPEAMGE